VPGNPYLPFSEIEVQQKEDGLSREESLDIMSNQLLPNINHLHMSIDATLCEKIPCNTGYFRVLRLPRWVHTLSRNFLHDAGNLPMQLRDPCLC
jgi:hypothetical protein